MNVSVTFNFDSIDDAFITLGKMLEGAEIKPAPGPAAQAAKEATTFVTKAQPSKAVQKFMEENNVQVADVTGTGKDGKITKKDVENYLQQRDGEPPTGKSDQSAEGATSKEDCREALKKLNDEKGMDVCLDVLSRFGVKRISDLKDDQYDEFVKKVDSVLAGENV